MSANHYRILQVSENATQEEVAQAYINAIEKWQQLLQTQTPQLKERTLKVITSIDQAYLVLSDPQQRNLYDQKLRTINASALPVKSSRKLLYTLFIAILIMLIAIAAGIFYIITNQVKFIKQPEPAITTSEQKPTTPPQQVNAISPELEKELQKVKQIQTQNAQDPELKALANAIAELVNQKKNLIINQNTQFLGAQASNQNIVYRFVVIDGITHSENILTAYLSDNFVAANNEVCSAQQINLAKGLIFTSAYYDTQGKLLGSFYIDQQVCESPMDNRLIKIPDAKQLQLIGVTEQKIEEPVVEVKKAK